MIHIKNIDRLMEVFIEVRDILKVIDSKRIELTISKMDTIIKESHEEKDR